MSWFPCLSSSHSLTFSVSVSISHLKSEWNEILLSHFLFNFECRNHATSHLQFTPILNGGTYVHTHTHTVIIPDTLVYNVYINMNWTSSRWMALEWVNTFNIPQYKWHINGCISSTLLSSNQFSSCFFRNKANMLLSTKLPQYLKMRRNFFLLLLLLLLFVLFFMFVCSRSLTQIFFATSPSIFKWIVVIRTREILLWLIYLKALMNFRPCNRYVSDKYWFCCKHFWLVEC